MRTGLYVYGIVDAGALDGPPVTRGVDPDHEPDLFTTASLAAVVSQVDVREFEGEALERNAALPDWLETKVRAHESVLDEILGKATVVPMRFGSIFSTPDGLTSMLESHEAALRASLDRVRGRSEWGVKVYCDPRSLTHQLAGAGVSPEARSGRDYLMQKKAQKEAQAHAAEAAAQVGAGVHTALASLADDATTMALRTRDPRSAVILNGAYLVDDRSREGFMGRVQDMQEGLGDAYIFEVTGPWPPYNFTSADVSGPHA